MTNIAIADNAQFAKDEISLRIERTESINSKFRNSFSGYTKNTGEQKATVFFLSLVAIGLFYFSPTILNYAFSNLSQYPEEIIETFCLIALYSICIFISLFTIKIIIRLSRIAKLDGYIRDVNKIKNVLTTNLESVDKVMSDLKPAILQKNISIAPDNNIDYEIEKYKNKADSYSEPKNKVLDALIKLTYWISAILFCIAFVVVTREIVAEFVVNLFKADLYDLIYLYVYPIMAFILFVIINYRLVKKTSEYKFGSYVLSLLSGPFAIPAVWVLCGIIYLIIHLIAIAIAIGVVVTIFAVIFNS